MRYIEDKDFNYNDILVKHLRAYNHQYTGDSYKMTKIIKTFN